MCRLVMVGRVLIHFSIRSQRRKVRASALVVSALKRLLRYRWNMPSFFGSIHIVNPGEISRGHVLEYLQLQPEARSNDAKSLLGSESERATRILLPSISSMTHSLSYTSFMTVGEGVRRHGSNKSATRWRRAVQTSTHRPSTTLKLIKCLFPTANNAIYMPTMRKTKDQMRQNSADMLQLSQNQARVLIPSTSTAEEEAEVEWR